MIVSDLIYKPKGAAGEYAEMAVNIYKGCQHACRYCYCPKTMRIPREQFIKNANPKKDFTQKFRNECQKLPENTPEIHLSFIGDCYQPAEMDLMLTRSAIEILIENNLSFTVLTKGGLRAVRDFDLLESHSKCSFGSSLVFLDQKRADHYELGAAKISERIKAIEMAHRKGVQTWVSLEPVIDPNQALEVIREVDSIVDHWKIGNLNHFNAGINNAGWIRFREKAKNLLQNLGADFHLKRSLTKIY